MGREHKKKTLEGFFDLFETSVQEHLRFVCSGSVKGMNTKAKIALRNAYGFKTYEVYETVLYHELRRLPEHEIAHQFC